MTDRPGETGVSRRTDEQQPDAYAFAGDMGVPISESMMEESEPAGVEDTSGPVADRPEEMGISRGPGQTADTGFTALEEPGVPTPESPYERTEPSAADNESLDAGSAPEDTVIADSVQSSVSDSDVDTASYEDVPEMTNIARDAQQDTWQRASDEQRDPSGVLSGDDLDLTTDASGEVVDQDQGPWEAESASDFDYPAASRGVRVWGEESDVAGLSAETGEGFGRDEDKLLTTGGEIDLENDEMPLTEAVSADDTVSLDVADEEGEVAFGGEDTTLVQDTLGLRESEDEPVRAGRNDDVSMRIGTGGPEEEERDSDLGKREDDVAGSDADEIIDEDSTEGISGDYGKAVETQTVPAVPQDEEAARPPSQGDVRENGATAQAAVAPSSGRASGRARSVPQGAMLAPQGGTCPADFPIKGNGNSRIYHMPGESSYDTTIPEYCFATEEDARAAGFRPRKR